MFVFGGYRPRTWKIRLKLADMQSPVNVESLFEALTAYWSGMEQVQKYYNRQVQYLLRGIWITARTNISAS